MIEQVRLIENKNFLTQSQIEDYYNLVSGQDFPYYFHPVTSIVTDSSYQCLDVGKYIDPFFVHRLYSNKNYVTNHEYFHFLMIPFFTFAEKEGVQVKTILRAKVNLSVSNQLDIKSSPHVDYPFDHNVFIYYFNDSDGDTVIYNEKYNGEDPGQLSEMLRIKPEAGKGIMFNGLRYHAPSVPKFSSHRIVLNVSFL
jgi:hypothetical protein